MDNEKEFQFLSDMVDIEIEPELFGKQIKLFSRYLVCQNPDYKYNETYLDRFCSDFLNFKRYVKIKHYIFLKVIGLLICNIDLDQTKDLQLLMDDFWIYSLQYKKNIFANMNSINNMVCRDIVQIKGIMIYEKKRYVFLKEYSVLKNESILTNEVDVICKELIQWTKEKYNAK